MLFKVIRNPFASLAAGPEFFNNMEHSYNVAGNEDPKDSFFNNMDRKRISRRSVDVSCRVCCNSSGFSELCWVCAPSRWHIFSLFCMPAVQNSHLQSCS